MAINNITFAGNISKDPDVNGQTIRFNVAINHNRFNKQTNQWEKLPSTWMFVKAFGTLATNAYQSLHKGDPVIVNGTLHTEEWVDDNGQQHSMQVVYADTLGHDLNRGVTQFRSNQRTNNGYQPAPQQNTNNGVPSAQTTVLRPQQQTPAPQQNNVVQPAINQPNGGVVDPWSAADMPNNGEVAF